MHDEEDRSRGVSGSHICPAGTRVSPCMRARTGNAGGASKSSRGLQKDCLGDPSKAWKHFREIRELLNKPWT